VDIDEGNAGGGFILSGSGDLGQLTPELRLEVGIDFWTKGWDVGSCEWSWTNFALLGNVRYDFKMNASFQPYGFAGPVLAFHGWDWECTHDDPFSTAPTTADNTELEYGLNFGLGAEFSDWDGKTPVARAGYNFTGGADYFFIQVGLRFPMGH
jgi:hypothetical protein